MKKVLLILTSMVFTSILLLSCGVHHGSYAKRGSHPVNKERNK